MGIFSQVDTWISLVTLTVLEIVLGIDNIVFISILTDRLPVDQQKNGRSIGLALAMVTRILLLLSITWVMTLTATLFNAALLLGIHNPAWQEHLAFSGRDLILAGGGLFLIYKSTAEIHHKLELAAEKVPVKKTSSFWGP